MITKWIRIFLYSTILFPFIALPVAHAKDVDIPIPEESQIIFTPAEQAWLTAHPNIQLGYNDAFEPAAFVDPDGSYRGIVVDILDALNKRLGTHIALRIDPIPTMHEKAKTKETDGIALLHPNYADKLGFLKTHSFYRSYPTVFGRVDVSFEHPDDFIGKKVAIIDKIYFSEKIIQPYKDRATILKVKDAREGLEMVHRKAADLFIGASPNNYLITKYRFFGVASKYVFYEFLQKFGMAIRSDWPELVSILNKGLSSFSEQEIDAIVAKWVQLPPQKEVIELTAEEKAWLKQDHTIRVHFSQQPPYYDLKDGKVVGLVVDLLNVISKNTGITFHLENRMGHFYDLLKGLIEHEGPDLIAAIMPTLEREKVILFTEPYITSPRFIFTRDDAPFVSSIENLFGKKIAVIKDYVTHRYLVENYPNVDLLVYNNNDEALRGVASGKAFAFIGDLFSTPAMINEFGLKNLKAACPSGLPDHPLAMGVRDDWPELRDILSKALEAIPASEKAAIMNKWATVKIEHGIRPGDVLKWVLVVVGVASGILILFMFWNKSLKKQVQARTGEIKRTNESLESEISQRKNAEDEIRKSRDYLKNLADSMGDVVFSVRLPERKIEWVNDSSFIILGYDPEELIGRTTEFLYPNRNEFLAFGDKLTGAVPEGKDIVYLEQFLRRKSGEVFPVELTVTFYKEMGEVVSATGIIRDITERKQAEEALGQSEQSYRNLFNNATDAIYIQDKEGRFLNVNQGAVEMYGYPKEFFIGKTPEFLSAPGKNDMKKIFGFVEDAFNGKARQYDFWGIRKNGEVFPKIVRSQKGLFQGKDVIITFALDITERRQTEETLRRSNAELLKEHNQRRILSKSLIDLLEKDRRQIAMELHDHIGQTLTSLKMNLEMIHGKLKPENTELEAQITAAQEKTIQTIKDVKNVSHGLRPAMIDALGVVSSLRELFNEVQQQTDIEIHFFSRGIPKRFEEGKELAIYRIAQEALSNIIRHARAKNIFVNLIKKGEMLSLSVEDDGVGFDQDKVMKPSKRKGPLGLLIMRERAVQLDGEFTLESQHGKGTHLLVEIPI